MRRCSISTLTVFAVGLSLAACSLSSAQQAAPSADESVPAAIPNAPAPQVAPALAANPEPVAPQSSPSSQARDTQAAKHEKSRQEVKEEERQRVLGIAPDFDLTYRHDAVSLTSAEKIELAFRSSVDPFTFAAAFGTAGYHETFDEDIEFGWGAEGYFKRSGAAYLDTVDGAMIGSGFLPALLRQDPRYFRMGPGPTIRRRLLYAIAMTFVCKGDNGRWQPNYSNIGGNMIAGALSNFYYPSQEAGLGQTVGNGMIITTEGAAGAVFDEFWPDISRKILHRDPTHGLDAIQSSGPIRQSRTRGETPSQ
ncbi:MAG: hypothetical protein ACP5E2_14625 [Terracidiphilus sp.]